jgi:hypothetical protein
MEATMRLDQGSLIFTPQNGECPSWETALGQSREPRDDMPPYYFKAEGYENMLKGMYFNSVPLAKTSCILGKKKLFVTASESYLNPEYQEIQLASKFDNVIVHFQNNAKIFRNTPIILLLTKIQDVNKSHYRRRSIKYSPHTTYDTIKNQESFEEIQRHYQERLMCYGFFIEHFDTLHLYCVSVDDNSYTYSNLSLPQTEWTDWADWELKEREKIQNETPIISSEKDNQEKKNNVSFAPTQIIYYGVPGCGKSYEVNKVINAELDKYGVTDKEYHKVRCVFHPEYCNADFVGQIYPYVKPDNGGVEYRFKPGPFAEIVRRAYRNPAEPFFLIIEEINRGNAAAIFGEMFQLLDRIRPEDGPEELSGNIYNTGWSSYGVTNIDVNAYVRQKSTDNPEKIEYDDSIPYGDKIKFINNTAVRLPPNLSIYATMNTNDQNVFTMDNAFQRRFKSKMIRNVLDENSAQYKTEIDDTGVCWGNFREWINEKILLPQTAVLKADDKCLGGWFITGEKINGVDKIKKEDFAEKVLKYLWDDVFKRNKSGEIFVKDDKVNSLSDLIDAFETSVGFESFEKIFKMNDVDKAKLQKQANT